MHAASEHILCASLPPRVAGVPRPRELAPRPIEDRPDTTVLPDLSGACVDLVVGDKIEVGSAAEGEVERPRYI
jgi:hypothetical protein